MDKPEVDAGDAREYPWLISLDETMSLAIEHSGKSQGF